MKLVNNELESNECRRVDILVMVKLETKQEYKITKLDETYRRCMVVYNNIDGYKYETTLI